MFVFWLFKAVTQHPSTNTQIVMQVFTLKFLWATNRTALVRFSMHKYFPTFVYMRHNPENTLGKTKQPMAFALEQRASSGQLIIKPRACTPRIPQIARVCACKSKHRRLCRHRVNYPFLCQEICRLKRKTRIANFEHFLMIFRRRFSLCKGLNVNVNNI